MARHEEMLFALRFMVEHPDAAVRILENSDLNAVAKLLSASPPDYVIPVLRRMMPEYSARLLTLLETEKTAALLTSLDANTIAIILRLIGTEQRSQILTALPTTLRKNTELLLDFSINTVGAWMSPHLLSVANDLKCKNVMKYLKNSYIEDDSEYIYVVDRNDIYQGRTRFLDLLKANPDQLVSSIMDSICPTLPAQMLLLLSREHNAWEYSDVLPVTSPEQKLLGILQHHTLRKGLKQQLVSRIKPGKGSDPISGIFEVYGKSLLAVLNTVSDAIDADYR